jgi:hypothetical protein
MPKARRVAKRLNAKTKPAVPRSQPRRAQPSALPTPERLAKAEDFVIRGEVGGILVQDMQIDRMVARGILNERQARAAAKFYWYWYNSGMAPHFAAMDLQRGFGGGSNDCPVMPSSEAQAVNRAEYRDCCDLLGIRIGRIVEGIVCRDETPEAAGRALGWGNAVQARAAATELLRTGLDTIAKEYGL